MKTPNADAFCLALFMLGLFVSAFTIGVVLGAFLQQAAIR